MKLFLILMSLSTFCFASDLAKRPAPFAYGSSQAVFSDFLEAQYKITYDITQKKASVEASIEFETAEAGNLVFDLQVDPTTIAVDGILTTSTQVQTPNRETTVRVLNRPLAQGVHVLTVKLPLTQLVEFSATGVKSAFWMSDLTDRGYLERYLPTNFIYDRIPMTFIVKFLGGQERQRVYANGAVETLPTGEVKITYRDELNTTCQYFHTVPEGTFAETTFSYRALDGREIPSVIYVPKSSANQSNELLRLKTRTTSILNELERDYGPFPHPSLTIYVAGNGGMEYSGATMTSESALSHELFHSYFARGVMPSDGNSGWIDEALASWRDNGYQRITTLNGTSQMANHGAYNRATDRMAYTFGERFMALLDGSLSSKGGLKLYLRELVEKKSFDPIDMIFFNSSLNQFYGARFEGLFRQYLYGNPSQLKLKKAQEDLGVHRQLSLPELRKLL